MTKHRLNQYRGSVSPAQIAVGMSAASKNAQRLAEDAALLLDAGRVPSAAALAILSIEESGKLTVLRWLALAPNEADIAEAWRWYRSHTKKNVAWIVPQLVANGARKLEDFDPIIDQGSDHPDVLDKLKQIAFYTDCLGEAHWSEPDAVIERVLASSLVKTAELLAKHRETTTLEVELWVKHMSPVWKGDMGWMKKALANFHLEMTERGLTQDTPAQIDAFLWGEADSS